MSDRKFEKVTATDPTDKFHRVRIRCCHEGCDETFVFARRGVIDPVHAAKWFRDKGWFVAGHEKSDLCPAHSKTNKASVLAKNRVSLAETTAPAPKNFAQTFPVSPEPVEPVIVPLAILPTAMTMSRADKRIIHNKLDEVYADENIGYRGNWSDEKVADDLGIPIQWVAEIREDTYGPDINNTKQQKEIEAMAKDFDLRLLAYRANVEIIQSMTVEYRKLVATMGERMQEFDTKVEQMETVIALFENQMKEWKR